MQHLYDKIGHTKQAVADMLQTLDDNREEILGLGVSRKTLGELTSRAKWLDTAIVRMEASLYEAIHKPK